MASGQIMQISQALQPGTVYATEDTIVGGSTPAEEISVFDFDSAAIEYLDFILRLKNYGGGGLTIDGPWTSEATSGDVIFGAAIRYLDSAITAAHTYSFTDAAAQATNGTARLITIASLVLADGAEMDNILNNKEGILRIRRNATAGGDTLDSNDAELWIGALQVRET